MLQASEQTVVRNYLKRLGEHSVLTAIGNERNLKEGDGTGTS